MITEDILKSTQTYELGYYGKSIYTTTGEWVPSSLKALESMWMRWTYGTNQVLFKCFNKIYAKNVSTVEKFDISYHVLHHFGQGFLFPLFVLAHLFIPGYYASLLIIALYFLPQSVGAATIYVNSIHKLKNTFWKKMGYLFGGFYLVDTLIMSVQFKSSVNFLIGKPQGWKVTEKGIENRASWKSILAQNLFHINLAVTTMAVSIFSWQLHFSFDLAALSSFAFMGLMSINLITCILLFGKAGRKAIKPAESSGSSDLILNLRQEAQLSDYV